MNTLWFIILGALLTAYAIFDGIDLGIGAMHLVLGKTEQDRDALITVIGPFWAGYEVFLVVSGGSMFAAFPDLYASSFSGFYLVLTLVLWLLMGRGGGIEFRNRVKSPLWMQFWDVVFSASSLLLALIFGAAVANVVRGVPMDEHGNFSGSFALTLNWYAILVGLLSVVLLAMQGVNFVAVKTENDLQARARLWSKRLFPIVAVLIVVVSGCSLIVRPGLASNFMTYPYLAVFPLLVIASIVAMVVFRNREDDNRCALASSVLIGSLMASAGASLYPLLLPALGKPGQGLNIYNAAAPQFNLVTAAIANVLALAGVIVYSIYIHRVFGGKMKMEAGHGY